MSRRGAPLADIQAQLAVEYLFALWSRILIRRSRYLMRHRLHSFGATLFLNSPSERTD